MNRFARQAVALLLCASMSTLMLIPVAASPLEVESVTVHADGPTDVTNAPGNAVGAGPWEQLLACIGCMAIIIAASGTGSIAAVAAVAGAAPQLVGGCVLGCIAAFSD